MDDDSTIADRPPTVHVETAGPAGAPVVVLVHGSMDRSAGMLRLSRRLDDEFLVVRYDRRGYGRSSPVGPPFDVATHVADLVGVIERHAPDRRPVLLFGHSFGGNVALGCAEVRPDLAAAVAVYETPLSWSPWWPSDGAGGAALDAPDPADAAEAFMRRLVGDAVWERLPAATRASRRREGASMLGELADLRRGAPWRGERISRPVLAMCGGLGRAQHRQGAETIAASIPGARLQVLDGAGHGAPNSHATELADALRSFVSASVD